MKASKILFRQVYPWALFSLLALLIASVIYIWLPHRTQTVEVRSTLQNGMKMDARFTLQSPWGWTIPNRLIAMDVSLNGKTIPVAKEAYYGLNPFDLNRKPYIAETRGFPEIVAWGVPKSSLTAAHWQFLNYSFSELDVMRNHQEETSYYSAPLIPAGQAQLAQTDLPRPVVVIGKDSIKKISPKDLPK